MTDIQHQLRSVVIKNENTKEYPKYPPGLSQKFIEKLEKLQYLTEERSKYPPGLGYSPEINTTLRKLEIKKSSKGISLISFNLGIEKEPPARENHILLDLSAHMKEQSSIKDRKFWRIITSLSYKFPDWQMKEAPFHHNGRKCM
ncbi:3225_t:CDS:2 [Diversispora eburnea]|uniref:3225_t:CDS:1 n=1 Tax=Diversispora eburnea TaxID=1213867 RepID=A0A9N8ZXS5_9GLOM|nr:3225_t:CDS:2 [Diversispora eburnea]